MHSKFIGAIVLLFVLCDVSGAAPKSAVDANKEKAKVLFASGTNHYSLSEYPEALQQFKEAFRIYPEPAFLFNIAQCQRQLNQREDAIRSYKSFLRNVSNSPNQADVQASIAKLEKEIADEHARAEEEARAKEAAARAQEAAAATAVVVAEPVAKKPIYKRAWFWGVIGGAVVVVGLGIGLGVGLTQTHVTYPAINAANGTYRF